MKGMKAAGICAVAFAISGPLAPGASATPVKVLTLYRAGSEYHKYEPLSTGAQIYVAETAAFTRTNAAKGEERVECARFDEYNGRTLAANREKVVPVPLSAAQFECSEPVHFSKPEGGFTLDVNADGKATVKPGVTVDLEGVGCLYEAKALKATVKFETNLPFVLSGTLKTTTAGCAKSVKMTLEGYVQIFSVPNIGPYLENIVPVVEEIEAPGKAKSYELCYHEEEPEVVENCGYDWKMFAATHTWEITNPGNTNKGTYAVSGDETIFSEPEGPCIWAATKGKKGIAYEGHYECAETNNAPQNEGSFRLLK